MKIGANNYKKNEVIFTKKSTYIVIYDNVHFVWCYDFFSGEKIGLNKRFHYSIKEEILKNHC